jgi:type IV secretory pathway protease TraF
MTAAAPEPRDAQPGVRPTDTALRLPYATGDLYVAPQPASADHAWRGYLRGGPGDLELVEVTPEDVVAIANEDRAERVDVIDTPAWPVAFLGDEADEE